MSDTIPKSQETARYDPEASKTPAEVSRGRNSIVGVTTAACRLLNDGTVVELIRDPQNPLGLNFLLWQSGIPTVVKRVERDGQIILPPRISAQKIQALTLPTGTQPGSLPKDLIADIATTISLYVDVEERALLLISHYVLYTWMQEHLPSATYLWIVGPLGSGKTVLLRVLNCMCRRALLGDFSQASLYFLADELQPTFFLDECDFRRSDAALLRFLRAGSSQDASVFRNGQVYRAFSAKVLASRQPPADAALRSRSVFISLAPMSRDVLPFGSEQAASVKERFQGRLLGFRLEAYSKLSIPKLPQTLGFTPRMRGIAQSLALPVQADADLVAKLFELLSEEGDFAKMDRATEPEWLAIEALFDACHERHVRPLQSPQATIITVGSVTHRINGMLERWGAGTTYEARAIGPVLRSIGIRTNKFGRRGYGVRLSAGFRRQVHLLARQYGISRRDITSDSAIESGCAGWACSLCDEFALTGGLRCIKPPKRRADSGPVRRSRPRSRGPLFANQDPAEVNPPPAKSAAFHAPNP